MRSNNEDQEEHEHDTSQLVSESAPDETHGVGIVVHVWELELDLSNDVRGVDGKQTDGDGENNTRYHADSGESAWDTERPQCNGLDNQANGQSLPAESLELGLALMKGRLLFQL